MSVFDIKILAIPAVIAVIGVAAFIYAQREYWKFVGS